MARSKWEDVAGRFNEIEHWLVEDGLNQKEIAKRLGISKTSMEKYKIDHPDFASLLKRGRTDQVKEVANALYKSATGYYYTVDEVHKVKLPEGGESLQVLQVQKFKGPDTAAMCFFLKNKDRKNWSDQPQIVEIRREELELRKQAADFKEW
jgi:transcriptional regulator with XRE-family HTH domain